MKWYSIRTQILVIVLVCYLVPTMLLGTYMGGSFLTNLQEKTEQALTSGAEHAHIMTKEYIDRAITLSKDATYDGELTQAFSILASGSGNSNEAIRLARTYLDRKYSREALFTFSTCFPTDDPTRLIYGRSDFEPVQQYQQTAHERVVRLGETLDTRCKFLQVDQQVYLVRNLYNLRMERFGMLVLGIHMELLTQPMTELVELWDGQFFVRIGDAGEENCNWDDLPLGLSAPEGGEVIAYTQISSNWDDALHTHVTVDKERIYGEIVAFKRLMAGLVVLLVPVMGLILFYVSKRIIRPITILSQASRRIEQGEWGITVSMHGADELGDLGRAFSGMSAQIAHLIDKTYKEEIALRDARIQAMQSRINPHFINNALESINWQARMEGSQVIASMVESLSVLLNASMAKGDKRMVLLREEVEVANAYFYFIGSRFGENLSVVKQISPDALEAQLPLLTIQPLLENAVEHGIAPAGGGEIVLTCNVQAEQLHLCVTNSGKPLNDEDRMRIQTALQGDNQGGQHLGLANIVNRLRLIYGESASITVAQDAMNRTSIAVSIPMLSVCETKGEQSGQQQTTNHI